MKINIKFQYLCSITLNNKSKGMHYTVRYESKKVTATNKHYTVNCPAK